MAKKIAHKKPETKKPDGEPATIDAFRRCTNIASYLGDAQLAFIEIVAAWQPEQETQPLAELAKFLEICMLELGAYRQGES